MGLKKKRADNGRYYLSGLAEVLNSYPKGYGLIQVGHAVDKLAEYEDLEEQNRLIKLPCAVGDTVYEVQRLRKRIQPYKIIAIKIGRMGERYYYWELKDGKGFYGNLKGFGDMRLGLDVFTTESAAEAALKEMSE